MVSYPHGLKRLIGALLAGVGVIGTAVAVQAETPPYSDGFENGVANWYNATAESAVAHAGTYGIRETGVQQTNATPPAFFPINGTPCCPNGPIPPSTTGLYVRLWVNGASIDAGSFGYNYTTIRVAYLKHNCLGYPCDTANYGFMYLSASGANFKVGVQDALGNTHTGTTTISFASNAWHELEFFLSDNGSGTYTYKTWVDGTAELNGTASGSGVTGGLDALILGDQRAGASDTFYADDFAIDTSYIS